MKKAANFTQGRVARAVKGATAGGLKIGRVSVRPDGTIEIFSQEEPQDEAALDAAKLDARLRGGADGQR